MKLYDINEKKKNENLLYSKGYNLIAGVDEVGRGPLCGPVVCACVILPKDSSIVGIDDSKDDRHADNRGDQNQLVAGNRNFLQCIVLRHLHFPPS